MSTAIVVSPVLADTVLARHGKIGPGTVNEALGEVVCRYDGVAHALLGIDVAGPTIFARDTTPATETQWIGWQLIVKQSGGGLPTETVKSKISKAQATDSSAPSFNPFHYDLGAQPPAGAIFSVSVKLYWFKPNGRTVAGWAKHRVDNYTWETPDFVGEYPAPACQGMWGNPAP
jgi:hypothetical protein